MSLPAGALSKAQDIHPALSKQLLGTSCTICSSPMLLLHYWRDEELGQESQSQHSLFFRGGCCLQEPCCALLRHVPCCEKWVGAAGADQSGVSSRGGGVGVAGEGDPQGSANKGMLGQGLAMGKCPA